MRVLRIVVIITVIVTIVATLLAPNPIRGCSNWVKLYGKSAKYLVLYDIDGDNELEVVTEHGIIDKDSFVPTLETIVFKADFDADGLPELITYTPSTGKLSITSNTIHKTYSLIINTTEPQVYNDGFIIGKYVFGAGRYIYFTKNTSFVPVVVNSHLYVVYIDPEKGLTLFDGTNYKYIFPIANTSRLVGGGGYNDCIYVLLSSLKGTALLRYNLSLDAVNLHLYDINITKAYFIRGVFLGISQNNVLYKITLDRYEPIGYVREIVYPAANMSTFIRISYPHIYVEHVASNGSIVVVEDILFTGKVSIADYADRTLAVSTDDGVYLWTPIIYPEVNIEAPPVVVADETFTINIAGNYDWAKITVGGNIFETNESPATYNISLNTPGEYTVSVEVCLGNGICKTFIKTINVVPRPLNIVVRAPKNVDPYGKFNITIEAYDGLSGENVTGVTCTVTVIGSHDVYRARPFSPVTVYGVPVGLETPIMVKCGGVLYREVVESISIPLSRPYMDVDIIYQGAGRFLIKAHNNVTGREFSGILVVVVDNVKKYSFMRQGIIVLPPGNHTLRITLYENNVLCLDVVKKIEYYEDISEVPTGAPVIVGDRVVTHTIVKTVNKTVTVTSPKIIEVEKTNTVIVIGVLVLGLGAGVMISLLLPKRTGKGE